MDNDGLNNLALRMTEAEYLAGEAVSEARREYVGGLVLACEPSTVAHSLIGGNMLMALHSGVRGRGGLVYKSAMRLRLEQGGRVSYLYPDVMADFSEVDWHATFVTTPCLIVEVMSAGTRRADMVYKAAEYLSLPSLQGYLMVDSERRAAELYRRISGSWQLESVLDEISLPGVALNLNMDEIYGGVTF